MIPRDLGSQGDDLSAPPRPSIQIHGRGNVVADAVHIHLLPASNPSAWVSRRRARMGAGIAFIAGATWDLRDTHPLLTACACVGALVTLSYLLGGKGHEPAATEEPPADGPV